jgi:hypothetical protein
LSRHFKLFFQDLTCFKAGAIMLIAPKHFGSSYKLEPAKDPRSEAEWENEQSEVL